MTHTNDTIVGTVGGTILALIAVPTQTVVVTIICAAIGAITSFTISLLLKALVSYFKKKKDGRQNNA